MTFKSLQNCLEQSKEETKYFFLWDKTGNVDTFYNYQANLMDFYKTIMKMQLGRVSLDEALEELRAKMVHSMRTGKLFVINLQQSKPDFTSQFSNDETNFPAEKVFDIEEWKNDAVNKKILKEGENINIMGDRGAFMLHRDFRICILAKY